MNTSLSRTRNRPWGLLEPDAWKAGSSGSEGAGAQQCAPATWRFRFQRRQSRKHGRDVTHVFPTPAACKRARQRVRTVLKTGQGRGESLGQMVEQINYGLLGWANYYAHTHASQAFDKLQAYTNRRLRRHLRRRRQKSGLGRYKEMPDRILYEKLGLAYIRRGRVRYVMLSVSGLRENLTSRSTGGRRKRAGHGQ